MKRLLDHDPLTGITNYFHYDEQNDTSAIESVSDVSSFLDLAQSMRNDDEITKKSIKKGWWHYCTIPAIVIQQMRQEDGVDVYDPNDAKKLGTLIETKYPYLKFTSGKHKIKG